MTSLDPANGIPTDGFPSPRAGLQAIVDQCFFTGTNFVASVLVGRYCGQEQFGLYALAFSIVMLAIAFQHSFFISAYVVVRNAFLPADQLALRQAMLISLLLTIPIAFIVAVVNYFIGGPMLIAVTAFAIPAACLRDFSRRMAIADLRVESALWIDIAVAAFQIGALLALALGYHNLNSVTAMFVGACIWGAIGIWSLGLESRALLGSSFASWKKSLGVLWPTARWTSLGQVISTIQAFIPPWIMASLYSIEMAGVYAACWTLVQVVSPIIEGFGNYLAPSLSKYAAEKNWHGFQREVFIANGLYAATTLSLIAGVYFFGRSALNQLYGPEYAEHFTVLSILSLSVGVNVLGIPASKALTQVGRAPLNVVIAATTLITTVVITVLLLRWFGPIEAAWGIFSGATFGTLAKLGFYRVEISKNQTCSLAIPTSRSLDVEGTQ
jgi:O-antigen/teichoic acid export membrane protein